MTPHALRKLIAATCVLPLAWPVLADSWKDESDHGRRGHKSEDRKIEEKYDSRTGEYKYEEKGPGYKYRYKVDRHGRRVEEYRGRGAPPPWASFGYPHPRPGPARADMAYLPPFGIDVGGCNRDLIGGVIGGATGGLLGSGVGKGDGRLAATAAGAVIGVLVGGAVGRAMDQVDQACVGQILEHAPDRRPIVWSEGAGLPRYEVVPTETYRTGDGAYCREYQTVATIGGRQEQAYGIACRQPDGTWQLAR